MNKRIWKTIVLISILLLGTLIGSKNVIACGASYSSPDVPPYDQCGYTIFCKHKGGRIRGPSYLQPGDTYGGHYYYPGYMEDDLYDTPTYRCVGEYPLSTVAAYVFSSGMNDHMELQYAAWADMTTNEGRDIRPELYGTFGYALEQEGEEYEYFHNLINSRGGYNPIDTTDTNNLRTVVDQTSRNYIVGPYSVDYLYKQMQSATGELVNCGIITGIVAKDQDGNEMTDIQIIRTQDGSPIYNYPLPGEQFYVAFNHDKYPNAKKINVTVKFRYLNQCAGSYHRFEGQGDIISSALRSTERYRGTYYWYEAYVSGQYQAQTMMGVVVGGCAYRDYKEEPKDIGVPKSIIPEYPDGPVPGGNLTMKLGGYVFSDGASNGKSAEVNSVLGDSNDKMLSGIMVTLYEENGQLASLYKDNSGSIRTNPTITDDKGYYEFAGLDSMKKYYVKYTYNGQIYTNTDYMGGKGYANNRAVVAAGYYNNQRFWQITSKATETSGDRTKLNSKFAEIGSYPENYNSSNDLGYLKNGKNVVYQYQDLIDVYKAIENYTRDYMKKNNEWPDLKTIVYPGVASQLSSDKEIKNKLQFIEDCMIESYTGPNGQEGKDLYPVYDKFVIDNSSRTIARTKSDYNGTYPAIYPGQLYVNLGVKFRSTIDLALYKDVMKVDTSINGRKETYYYDKRAALGATFRFGIRFSDMAGDPSSIELEEEHLKNIASNEKVEYDEAPTRHTYTQYVRSEDIKQAGNGTSGSATYDLSDSEKLTIDVMYKIMIKNQSSTVGFVTELVDYYNSDYEITGVYLGDKKGTKIKDLSFSQDSIYGAGTKLKPANGYSATYIKIDDSSLTRLSDGESECIYVTMKMKNPSKALENAGVLDGNKYESNNYVEINGYKSYYDKTGAGSPGYIDIDSTPGNFKQNEYKKGDLLEDDTDLAPSIMYASFSARTMEGIVFEDRVTTVDYKNLNAVFTGKTREADGKYTAGKDIPVKDARVELLEVKGNKLYVRAVTYTDENGYYKFNSYIPGEYFIRYIYGKDDGTALTNQSENYKGSNFKSYNGQDFQATKAYNTGRAESGYEENVGGKRKSIVVNEFGSSPYFWYQDTQNNSCATDVAERREEVINYSKVIRNHIAEVLNSYKDKNVNRSLVDELENNTYMVAQTPKLTVETEYMKTQTVYDGTEQNDKNYEYKIGNINFGIVERPRSELDVKKYVKAVKLTASNGEELVLGYVDDSENVHIEKGNMKWASKLKVKNGIVSIEADQELLQGAKLEVKYDIKVTNVSEVDTYKGQQVKTSALKVIDYIDNNYVFDQNKNPGWTLYAAKDLQPGGKDSLVNSVPISRDNATKAINLSVFQNLAVTNDDNEIGKKELAPNESASTSIILEKTISETEDDSDDLVYENDVEILETKNTVGRKNHINIVGDYDPINKKSVPGDRTWEPGVDPDPDIIPGPKDYDSSEKVVITPPTGANGLIVPVVVVSSIIILAALCVTIVIIKKKAKDNK